MPRFLARRYLGRRMLVLAGLGFASGLPSKYKTLGATLQAWLSDAKVDIETIGLFGLVGLPFALKFLWAPLLDRYVPPFLGRRRGWLVVFQGGLVIALALLAVSGPTRPGAALGPLAVSAVVVAFLAASQDVVADAYRTDLLERDERAAGAAMFVNGYRLAMLASGGGALLLSTVLPWRVVYLLLAVSLGLGVVAALAAPEPPGGDERPATLGESLVMPGVDFARRYGRGAVWILLFVFLFKIPDAMAGAMTTPLLLGPGGLGFDKVEVAWIREWLGLGFALGGAWLGGPLVARLGLVRSLWVLGFLQAVSNLGFALLCGVGRSAPALAAVVSVESLCQGLTAAGFVAFLMALCNRRYSATQYALLSGLMALTDVLVGSETGYLVAGLGFSAFFVVSALAGLPGMLLLLWIPRPDAPASDAPAPDSPATDAP